MDLAQIDDIEVMRVLLRSQISETERLRKVLAKTLKKLNQANQVEARPLLEELRKIQQQYEAALKREFGPKSERRGQSQPADKKPQSGHGPKQQPSLPVEEVVHEVAEEKKTCSLCGEQMQDWHGQDETSYEVDIIPAQVRLVKHVRRKCRCPKGCGVELALGPRRLVPGGRYSINFALHVALQKYAYHMPLDRLVKQFRRQGLEVTTATLWDYVEKLAKTLEPAYQRLETCLLEQPILGVDETWWRLLKGPERGKSKKWWVWVRQCELGVHYTLADSRGGDVAKQLLKNFKGTLICDGYGVYEQLVQANPNAKLANCWSHARRGFLPLEQDPIAARCLRVIQKMYWLESKARAQQRTPEQLLRWRQRKTKPLLKAFFKWSASIAIPATGKLRDALRYVSKRQTTLMRFLDDPRLEPDNNVTERTIRGVTVGRKNHYGSRSLRGTKVAAILYSLLESAERVGLNPHQYLALAVEKALAGEKIPLPHQIAFS